MLLNRSRLLALILAGILAADGVTFAQSSPDPAPQASGTDQDLQDLRRRIELLEQQNQLLLEKQKTDEKKAESDDEPEMVPDDPEDDVTERDEPTAPVKPKPDPGAENPLAEWYETGTDLKMSATWRNGLEIESKHKDFRVHIGGRTQFDGSWYQTSQDFQTDPAIVNPVRDGVDFRRARFRIDGLMYEQIEWVTEFDFVNSVLTSPSSNLPAAPIDVPAPTDLYWTFTKLPVIGNLRVGNQKEWIGFERLVSSRFLPFMERSFNQDAFYGAFNNGFTPGITAFNTMFEERGVWAIGIYKPTTNIFAWNTGGGEYAVTGRVTALPWFIEEGRGLLHLGLSARTAGMDNGLARYRTRGPERSGVSATWPIFADSGQINGDGQQMLNFEVASNVGSLTLQAEYLLNFVQGAFRTGGPGVGTLFYQGGYVELSYFLTGEHREYNRKTGFFERVVPYENAFLHRGQNGAIHGRGAWQLAARYNYLDLNNQGINGGRLNDVTVGLNWFLNPNMKVQWNYSITERVSPNPDHDGPNQGFGMRLAHDF